MKEMVKLQENIEAVKPVEIKQTVERRNTAEMLINVRCLYAFKNNCK